jgi:ABC-type branched-subunit amino acid transport system ATPase component
VLELRGLSRRYGEVVALDDLSFGVREGQMFGFVAPNGAGKTTAMRIVLGVLEPDAGQVFWRGSPIGEQTRRRADTQADRVHARGPRPNVFSESSLAGRVASGMQSPLRQAAWSAAPKVTAPER